MAIDFGDLNKSNKIKFRLKKKGEILKNLRVKLSWDKSTYEKVEFDADLNIAILERNGTKTITLPDGSVVPKMKFFAESAKSLIYFDNETSINSEVVHGGDNREGGGEFADIFLDKVPAEVDEITLFGIIYEGSKRNQNWRDLNASMSLINMDTNRVIAEYTLGETFAEDEAIHFGSLFKNEENDWEFLPHGIGYKELDLEGFTDFWQP
jgi:stress response protein SCP2